MSKLLPKFLSTAMMQNYILNEDGEPELCTNTMKWAQWYGSYDRTVARSHLINGAHVSTVFLGIDHSFSWVNGLESPPILWETMIFELPKFEYQERYTSREAALRGHRWALVYALCQKQEQELDSEVPDVDPV